MAEIPDKERRTIIISILNTHAKSGCSLVQLNSEFNLHVQCAKKTLYTFIWHLFWQYFNQHFNHIHSLFKIMSNRNCFCVFWMFAGEYEQMTGQKMAKSRAEAIELLKSMSDAVKNENGLYFSESKKSLHIVKFVEDQKESSKGIGMFYSLTVHIMTKIVWICS